MPTLLYQMRHQRMRRFIFLLIILLLSSLLTACNVETVTRNELLAKTRHWQEPKMAAWYYTGSSDRYDFFHQVDINVDRKYRVHLGDIPLSQRFPLTTERKNWIVMPWGPPNRAVAGWGS